MKDPIRNLSRDWYTWYTKFTHLFCLTHTRAREEDDYTPDSDPLLPLLTFDETSIDLPQEQIVSYAPLPRNTTCCY